MKLAVFDLDCTLAEHGKGITAENIARLCELEETGVRIAVCSGKPTYYLCGMFRQVGLRAPILIGEVGATIQFGVDLPPKKCFTLPFEHKTTEILQSLKKEILAAVPDMWFQPNEVNLSPFPKNEKEFSIVENIIERHKDELNGIHIYRYTDAIDFVPDGIHKRAALEWLAKELALTPADIVAVGDSTNDYPMFAFAGESYGIALKDTEKATHNVANVAEALRQMLRKQKSC